MMHAPSSIQEIFLDGSVVRIWESSFRLEVWDPRRMQDSPRHGPDEGDHSS